MSSGKTKTLAWSLVGPCAKCTFLSSLPEKPALALSLFQNYLLFQLYIKFLDFLLLNSMLGVSLIVDQTPPKFLRLQSHLRHSFTVTDAVSFQPRNKENVYCT